MRIFFIGEGRLGNQIFQYVAIRKLFGNGIIYAPNMVSLKQVFKPIDNLKVITLPKKIEQVIRKILTPIMLRPLFKLFRLGNYCVELEEVMVNGTQGCSGKIKITTGLLPVTFVDGGYFQNFTDLLKPEFFCRLEIQNHVLEEARTLVNKITSGRQWPAIVMHVRRGDYLGHSTYGLTEVVLTEDYFKRALKLARNHIGSNAEVLIVTDDQIWCNQFLSDMQPFTVVSSSEAVDFALLSMFRVAIISNSTFSLAAACVSKTVEHVFAPEYWFGHSVGEWYPPRVRVKDRRFTYV